MGKFTTITLLPEQVDELFKRKIHRKDSYIDIVGRLLDETKKQ